MFHRTVFIADYKLDATPMDLVYLESPDLFLCGDPHKGQAVIFSGLPLIFLLLLTLGGGNNWCEFTFALDAVLQGFACDWPASWQKSTATSRASHVVPLRHDPRGCLESLINRSCGWPLWAYVYLQWYPLCLMPSFRNGLASGDLWLGFIFSALLKTAEMLQLFR